MTGYRVKNALLVILFLFSLTSFATEQTTSINQTDSVADSTLQEGKIIAYYNRDWQQVPANARAFYYRKLISIDANKGYWIQDFYTDTHTKQIDPVLVVDKADILQGHITPNEGEVMVWFRDGLKKEQSQYQNGQIQSVIKWHRNGQKELEGYYKKGERQGVWTSWHQNGNKRWQGSFEKGMQQGVWQYWYPSGELNVEGAFKEGKRQDLWVMWSRVGKKEREMQFEQGEKIAQWKDFEEEH